MSAIKPGDVMLTKSCRMVRVQARYNDPFVAAHDYRGRLAVRAIETNRLSYHHAKDLTPVHPPATPQDIKGESAEIHRLGDAVRDGSATPEMAYAWLTHPYVCTLDMVKAAARIMASAPPAVWQPIETCPTGVKVWIGGGGCPEVHVNILVDFGRNGKAFGGLGDAQQPTHWQPYVVPSPPTPGENR